ncbi:MAG: hypothetical protein RLZZ293_59 [Pseudomonadota bacterium]|jgi:putative transposase
MPFSLQLVEFDGEVEHVYLLINYPLQGQLSKMINSIKGLSSILLKNYFSISPRAILTKIFLVS